MGCESSLANQQLSDKELGEQDFKLAYRQFIMNSRGEIFEFYHFSTVIHRSPSTVIRRVYHRVNKSERVCKIVPVENLRQLSCIKQVEVLKNIEHPNAIKIYEYFIEKHHVYMILQSIKGITLNQALGCLKQLPLSKILSIMKQLLSVINMMHTQNIAHRSIHPEHIMLQFCEKQYIVKLIDFSSSGYADSPKLKPPKFYRNEKIYNSPESESCPLKHDIYCCGLIFLSLLGGSRMLKNIRKKQQKIIQEILQPYDRFKNLEPLLKLMLKSNPNQRITAFQILNNEIFTTDSSQKDKDKIILNNLRKFNIKGRLKSTLWMFATVKLQFFYNRVELMNEFYNLDKNKDGKIQFDELKQGFMNSFGLTEEEAVTQTQKTFKYVDKNNSGEMDYYEFVMGSYMMGKKLSQNQLLMLFNEIDANKDGMITQNELNQAVEGIQQFELLKQRQLQLNFQAFKQIMHNYFSKMSGMMQ